MKTIGGLFPQVVEFNNLYRAAHRAARGKSRVPIVRDFLLDLEPHLLVLQDQLKSGEYRPSAYREFTIHEPKQRIIRCAAFRDRVVHHAICGIIEPYLDRRLIFDTYACRKQKGTHRAIARAQQFARRNAYFLKCDISGYFGSIDHSVLIGQLERLFREQELLHVLRVIITSGGSPGLPIGNLTSQHFANLYLSALDHFVKHQLKIKAYVRYMDDFLLFSPEKDRLRESLRNVDRFLSERLRLRLKESALRLAPVHQGLGFLGFNIYPQLIRLKRSALIRARRKLKITTDENRRRSVYNHMKTGDTRRLRQKEFGLLN